ncbi:peptide chain release factor N(5)-glutamine methyltransferase [uncultured Jatrophihabitans sp.]|uniref:peptide chain release factor N(5)-glutamine methyltransferase n=1 Tax=uncultured Jatrophihabitans sp. TaxID=1610747 RepID=UPI0035CB5C03
MSVAARSLLAEATERLSVAGVDSPRVDAELLLAALLDRPRGALLTLDTVPDSVARRFDEWVTRRVRREPLQHITGRAPFRHLVLDVGPGVFVPRPETELLVDAVLPHLSGLEAPVAVDLCAGSGALGLAIADEVPAARVLAVERSGAAARWLTGNAAGTSVRVLVGDIRDPELLRSMDGRADAVVCNPPYVPLPTDVAPEVLADPGDAVFAGADGLDLMSTVVTRAAALLRPGGILAVEHDDTQGEAVPGLLEADGRWTRIADHDDLTGRSRYSTARRS